MRDVILTKIRTEHAEHGGFFELVCQATLSAEILHLLSDYRCCNPVTSCRSTCSWHLGWCWQLLHRNGLDDFLYQCSTRPFSVLFTTKDMGSWCWRLMGCLAVVRCATPGPAPWRKVTCKCSYQRRTFPVYKQRRFACFHFQPCTLQTGREQDPEAKQKNKTPSRLLCLCCTVCDTT